MRVFLVPLGGRTKSDGVHLGEVAEQQLGLAGLVQVALYAQALGPCLRGAYLGGEVLVEPLPEFAVTHPRDGTVRLPRPGR